MSDQIIRAVLTSQKDGDEPEELAKFELRSGQVTRIVFERENINSKTWIVTAEWIE